MIQDSSRPSMTCLRLRGCAGLTSGAGWSRLNTAIAKQLESTPDAVVQNYFNYFTEIEEHFQRRRGSLLLLSTIDWALIETWREAGIPLAAVLQGIDAAFDKFEARKKRTRRVNGLAYCAQEVLSAMEAMKEAAVGAAPARPGAAEQG